MKSRKSLESKKMIVFVFLLSLLLMFVTYLVTQSMVMKIELHDFTQSVQKDTKKNLESAKRMLDGMVEDLNNTSKQILQYGDLKSPEARAVLGFSHKLNLFDVTFVSDMEGNAHDESGHEFSVADQEYFQKVVEKKKVVFSEILPSRYFGAIQIVAFPMITEEGEHEGVLFGLFAIETFSHLINAVVEEEQNIYIVDSNGIYIHCFDKNHAKKDHGNFWVELDSRKLKNITIEELQDEFHSRKEGGFSYFDKESNMNRYGYHMPLGIQDWQIVLTVEETVVNSHIESIRCVGAMDLFINTICVTTMLFCIYFYFKKTNLEIIAVNEEISKNNEMLRMAVDHTNHVIFEYDVHKREITFKTAIPNSPFKGEALSNVPDCILAMNLIADESKAAVKDLFERIKRENSCQADVQIICNHEEKIWYRVRMYNLCNEKGSIIATVGSAEDISMLKKGEAAIKRRDEMYKSFTANSLLYARVNLDLAMVTELNGREVQIPYQSYLEKCIEEKACEEYHSYIAQMLSVENLRESYQQGKEILELQCQMRNQKGPIWVSCLVQRVHMSHDAKVTFMIRDIDQKKRQEIALKEQAERDGLTGLYNAVTTRSKINEGLASLCATQGTHVFILFDLDNFKKINDSFGHACGDQVLIDVANILKERFRSSDIIGRLGGDEFVVMLFNVRSEKYMEFLMDGLKEAVTKKYTKDQLTVLLSASMGTALAPSDGTTFEELYVKADKALYKVKNEGKNGYMRYQMEHDQ